MPSRPLVPAWLAVVLTVSAAFVIVGGCATKHNAPAGSSTPKELDSGNISSGTTYSHRFFNSGDYGYHCSIHPTTMTGTVSVNAGAPDSVADVTIASIAPFPAAAVKPGGKVTWHNTSGMAHTVTSN